jgi:hypothetical protein
MLSTGELIHLNTCLITLVRDNKITASERESLLHKAGLLKLEDGRWRENSLSILTIPNL